MLFDSLEERAINLIKRKFSIVTYVIDTEEELSLIVDSVFDGKVVTTHKQDLLPLLEAFKKRL